jgi:hypothetical protein
MYEPSPIGREPTLQDLKAAAASLALLIALFAVFAFASPRDPTKVVAGLPCSILSEEQISGVLGTPMRLMPSSGAVCQYASTESGVERRLFVVARHETSLPGPARDVVTLHGIGDAAIRSENGTYVRFGDRAFAFTIVPRAVAGANDAEHELRLATMVRRPLVARMP